MTTLDSIAAKDYMSTDPVTFTPDMEVMVAINILVKRGISGATVVDEQGRVVGLLSEKDCLKVAVTAGYEGVPGGSVSEYMSPQVVTVEPETSILQLAEMFVGSPYKRFPVVKGKRLVGEISRSDVLRAINDHC